MCARAYVCVRMCVSLAGVCASERKRHGPRFPYTGYHGDLGDLGGLGDVIYPKAVLIRGVLCN